MRRTKEWLLSTCLVAALAGTAMLLGTSSSLAQPRRGEERREERGGYWRYHDGRWSYWHAGDRRWYYTDGSHWYYHDGHGWQLYRFDRQFGREGFERGRYQPPGAGADIVPPRHDVYRPR
jgi:hypothetical protein